MADNYGKSYEELRMEFLKKARKADDRLRALEKASEQKGYRTATQWAYRRAMKDIQYWSGEDAVRFNRDIPKNKQQLIAKLNDIEQFLFSNTSTKTKIKAVYKQRADTFNKKYGTDFTWQDMGKFFESGAAEKIAKMYGSETAYTAMGVIQKKADEIKDAIKDAMLKDIRTGNAKVDEAVQDILKNNLVDISEFL